MQCGGGTSLSSCIINAGNVFTWGYNSFYKPSGTIITCQLGFAGSPLAFTPTIINNVAGSSLNNRTITSISAGGAHSFALDNTNQLHIWGANTYGQLGNNQTNESSIPILLSLT